MRQKVWVIDDQSWNGSPGRGLVTDSSPAKKPIESRPLPKPPQKSPALSFSLSMLVWGSGQMYIGEYGLGSIFMAAMVFFYSVIPAIAVYRDSASRFFAEIDFSSSVLTIGAIVLILVGLLFWLVNAVDAYYRAARLRSEPFPGVDNKLWALFGSLLFPGWGQFLNAQPKKGLFFLLFGGMGIFSAFVFMVALCFWPELNAIPVRSGFEICLTAALLLIPLSLLMWIVSAYDSFSRRKPKLNFAGYNARSHGATHGLFPRSTAILGLLLAISVGMQFIPKKFYLDSLEQFRIEMQNSNMEIIPELLRKITDFIDR